MKFVPAAKHQAIYFLIVAASLFLLGSCTVRNYPAGKPFVYQTDIKLEGKFKGEERKTLEEQLAQQLHDSVRVRRQRKFLFFNELNRPPVYDSLNAGRSVQYMRALLHSLGYYRDSIAFFDSVRKQDDQLRTYLTFRVIPGRQFQLDSVYYNLLDSAPNRPQINVLQELTVRSDSGRLLKKGEPFSTPVISAELDRLTDLYRNNGFLLFGKEQLWAVWDTVGLELILPAFDPEAQARQLEAIRRQREQPSADVEIRLRPNPDSNKLVRYHIGNVTVYPDLTPDSASYTPTVTRFTRNDYTFVSYANLFKTRKLVQYIRLPRGSIASQADFLRTQNRFNNIGSWQQVSVTPFPRPGTDTVDFTIRLIPDKKYYTNVNFDVSRNTGYFSTESNLIGIGANFALRSTNFLRSANQYNLNVRYGVELSNNVDSLVQTQQFAVTQSVTFPRMVPRFRWLPLDVRENARTQLNLNVSATDRLNYFRLFTFNTSWGYDFSWKRTVLSLRMPNVEYNVLTRRKLLDTLIKQNASYKYIFNDGLIISSLVTVAMTGGKDRVSNFGRITFEESGLISGIFKPLMPKAKLQRFVKTEVEFTQNRRIRPKSSIAWRLFGGVGYGLPFSNENGQKDSTNFYLPFFRQYYAGGPNSMRAWGVRKLGPGSSIKSFNQTEAPDRFGDMRLEANVEYRFFLTNLFGFPLEGAFFTDIGNVWFLRDNPDFPDKNIPGLDPKADQFRLRHLWRDIAVGVGYGLRWDFSFLKARFDFGYKAKDPSPDDIRAQNKWFYNFNPGFGKNGAQFQLGINYPF